MFQRHPLSHILKRSTSRPGFQHYNTASEAPAPSTESSFTVLNTNHIPFKFPRHGNCRPRRIMSKPWMPEDAIPLHIKKLLEPLGPNKRLNYILAFFNILRLLKTQKRTGWLDHKIPRASVESISDHMYRMSVMTMIIPNNDIDKDKCTKIAVVHDIAEALVGDITPFDLVTKPEKSRREFETIKYLSGVIQPYNREAAAEIMELWLDYEHQRCIEARYVKDIDKLEMIQQAWDFEQQYGDKYNLDQFYSSRSAIKTPEISELADALLEQRNEFIKAIREGKEVDPQE